jgi:hypothetical protein
MVSGKVQVAFGCPVMMGFVQQTLVVAGQMNAMGYRYALVSLTDRSRRDYFTEISSLMASNLAGPMPGTSMISSISSKTPFRFLKSTTA